MNAATFLDVSKSFGRVKALEGFSLSLRAGELTALLGPNGAGKSTALSLLLGLLRPTRGRVEVLGGSPAQASVRARIGTMPQESAVPATLTVREAAALFASFYPHPMPVAEALALADITALAHRRAGELSGGQRRRLAFALAVVGRPQMLLLDEPTAGMDAGSRAAFWQGIAAMQAAGCTTLLTTHYLEEAQRAAARVVVMNSGRILADASPDDLRARATGAEVSLVSALGEAELQRLAGVTRVQVGEGGHAHLHTATPEALVRELVRSGVSFGELEVTRATLEQVYLDLLAGAEAEAGGQEVPA